RALPRRRARGRAPHLPAPPVARRALARAAAPPGGPVQRAAVAGQRRPAALAHRAAGGLAPGVPAAVGRLGEHVGARLPRPGRQPVLGLAPPPGPARRRARGGARGGARRAPAVGRPHLGGAAGRRLRDVVLVPVGEPLCAAVVAAVGRPGRADRPQPRAAVALRRDQRTGHAHVDAGVHRRRTLGGLSQLASGSPMWPGALTARTRWTNAWNSSM